MKLAKIALVTAVLAISVLLFAALRASADTLEVGSGKAYSDIGACQNQTGGLVLMVW